MSGKLRDSGVKCLVWLLLAVGTAAGAGQAETLSLALKGGALVGDSDTFRFREGEEIHILWASDEAVELHLHGYDLTVTAGPGAPVSMRFTGLVTGRFPVTRHGTGGGSGGHRALVYIEIHPR